MNTKITATISAVLLLAAFMVIPGRWDGAWAQTGKPHQKHPLPTVEVIAPAESEEPVFTDLPGQGKKCWIGEDFYFMYKFDKKPKLGTAILKVQLFDKKGARASSLGIVGMSDMPSMRGAHDSGEVPFKLNKKGDYLLPVNVVMPGEWEVKLIFLKDKEPVFRGRITFKV